MIKNVFSLLKRTRLKNESHSKKYYENLLSPYIDLLGYCNLLVELSSKSPLNAERKIELIKNLDVQLMRNHIMDEFGKPEHKHMMRFGKLKIEIFIYRIYIGKQKVRFETHFMDNQLFYYNYHFPYINDQDEIDTLNLIKIKYLNQAIFDKRNFFIVDSNYWTISIDKSKNLKINYFLKNVDIISSLLEKFDNQEFYNTIELNKDRKELFLKL